MEKTKNIERSKVCITILTIAETNMHLPLELLLNKAEDKVPN